MSPIVQPVPRANTPITSVNIFAPDAPAYSKKAPYRQPAPPRDKPMLPPPEDPAIVMGNTIQNDYTTAVAAIRLDNSIVDVERARRIVALWQTANTRLVALQNDMYQRRRNRVDALSVDLPVGPGISPNTSAADRSVLMSAWRAGYNDANGMTVQDLASSLAEAEKWGDDLAIRAALTVALEQGYTDIVDMWATPRGLGDQMTELRNLSQDLVGGTVAGMFETLAFRLIPKPPEAWDFPGLEAIAATGR